MDIDLIREKLADKLCSAEENINWIDILQDTSPGNYGVEDVYVDVSMKDVWVDIPERTFSFKNTNLSFSARLGGSSDKSGYDETFKKIVSGNGKFDFATAGKDIKIINFFINEDIELYGED
jgi:hypothetical protein